MSGAILTLVEPSSAMPTSPRLRLEGRLMTGSPLTDEQRAACSDAKRCAEAAERALIRSSLHVADAGIEQNPLVVEVVADLVDEYLLLAAGEAVLPPPALKLPSYFAKVAAKIRERGWPRPAASSVRTDADLANQLAYLEGFPEAQRTAREAFRQRQRRAAA
jgi:hypothetical protein